MTPAVVTGAGHAFPHTSQQEELWNGFFAEHYSDSPLARRLFSTAGVKTRHAVANPLVENVSSWSTGARMSRYLPEALQLGKRAIHQALAASSIDAADIGLFVVVSCTGYATPGLDTLIAHEIGMSNRVQRLIVGHMGCYAALPGLTTASDYVTAHQQPALLLCVELASLHIQPPTNDVEQMVAHALFSDAASAVVVEPAITTSPQLSTGLRVVDTAIHTNAEHADLMTWNITDLGFRMRLSQKIPDILALHIRSVVEELLNRHQLSIDDISGWAAHPGGPRILDVIADELQLEPDALEESRAVLAEHGNCSSPTVLIVLDDIRKKRELHNGEFVVALAFGPGLTLYATLLQA